MQQPQQKNNLLLFFVISFLIVMTWSTLQRVLWPPKKPTPSPDTTATPITLPEKQLWAGLPPALALPSFGSPGLGDAVALASQVAVAEWGAGDHDNWASP